MELPSLLIVVAACILIIVYSEPKKSDPGIPERKPDPDPGSLTVRSFSWVKSGISKTFNLATLVNVRNSSYEEACSKLLDTVPSKVCMNSGAEYFDIAKEEILHNDFGAFNYELNQVADYLKGVANSELISDIEFAEIILSFTQEQCIPYQLDKDSKGYEEYLRFPLETVHDTTGDCDCKAILACALFKTLGYRVAFALLPGHAALLITLPHDDLPFANFVWQGKRWFYCETTGDNWSPGMLPDSMDPSSINLMEV